MYVKRELARVLYYDMFEKGRVVIKQGKRIDNVEKVSICPMLGKPRQSCFDSLIDTTLTDASK